MTSILSSIFSGDPPCHHSVSLLSAFFCSVDIDEYTSWYLNVVGSTKDDKWRFRRELIIWLTNTNGIDRSCYGLLALDSVSPIDFVQLIDCICRLYPVRYTSKAIGNDSNNIVSIDYFR